MKHTKKRKLKRLIRAASYKTVFFLNVFLFNIFRLLPLKEYNIIFESEGDYCDNSFALFNHLRQKKELNYYKAIWAVDNLSDKLYKNYVNTSAISKDMYRLNVKTMYCLATSAYFIYDHNNLYSCLKKRKKQRIVYLSHGRGFKASKGIDKNKIKTSFDVMFTTGKIGTDGLSYFWQCNKDQVKELGYPRNDNFFTDLSTVKKKVYQQYNLSLYNHIFLWMPTFRKTNNAEISENYLNNETGLPLLKNENDIESLNKFLVKNKVCILLKLHHLQSDLQAWSKEYSNIKLVTDNDIKRMEIQLYEFVAITNCLITDYSSIAFDYMLLNKPIIFTIDDYEEYKKSRGFYPENALDYMVGYHIETKGELINCLKEICNNQDIYKEKRKEIMSLFFKYEDGNTSERILNYLDIK